MKIGITYDTAEMYAQSETQNLHFDFAFSFAGEDREIVEKISNQLQKKGHTVFYDNDYAHLLVGKDLYRGLRDLYRNKCRFVVCFISESYKKKIWTNLEMTAVKERLMETFFVDDFLIPIMLRNTEKLEDIPSFIGFYKHESLDATVDLLDKKIKSTLKEDVLITSVDKFINHLCENVYRNLKNTICCVKTENNIITVMRSGKKDSYSFEAEKNGFTKCILLRKNQANNNGIELPTYLIHWNKNNGLQFTVYNFSIRSKEFKEEKTLSELIRYLSGIIAE